MAAITNQQLLDSLNSRFDGLETRFDTLEKMVAGIGETIVTIAENYVTHDDLAELSDKLDQQIRSDKALRQVLVRAAAA
jgi:hypothetical protein